ncbi:MAG: DUF1501 domain-containing protein [Myxococcota bacterium]
MHGTTLSRRALLALGAGGVVAPRALAGPAPAGDRRLIVVFVKGGWDTTYFVDPKLGLPTVDGPELDEDPGDPYDREWIRTFGEIPIVVNDVKRPNVSRFFERWADRCAVVNGIATGSIAHGAARMRVLSGSHLPDQPDLCSAVGADDARYPVGALDFSGDGQTGVTAPSTARIGRSRQLGLLAAPVAHGDALDAYFRSRLTQLGPDRVQPGADEALDRARRLRDEAGVALSALPLATHELDDDVTTAVDLLAAGVARAALLESSAAWDTHTNNPVQHNLLDDLFSALGVLADGLDAASLLDDTLVVVVSEMTRSPRRNDTAGKAHWPGTSAVLFGAGVSGGRVVGATDADLLAMAVDPVTGRPDPSGSMVTHGAFAAGILRHLDVDPARWLPDATPFSAWAR